MDLDAQAILFDGMGQVVDAAFYNNMQACNGAVQHSGDNQTGEGGGDDEFIRVDVDSVPAHVTCIMFVVCAYKGGSF